MPTRKRGRPYVYPPTVILRCFIVRIWFRLDSNNRLHVFLNTDCRYNHKLALACGLVSIPSRRTFDRRLKTISTNVKQMISTMGYLFVTECMADPSITATDSSLLKAKGPLWHKSSMKKGIVPCPDIDTDTRWGYSHTKGWVFGYKLHLTSTAGEFVVPFSVFSLPYVLYKIADPGYDDKNLYKYSKKVLGIDLVCPVERYESTSKERLELVCFYESVLGKAIYSQRRISIEPLIEHIKSIFRIDPLPARGFHTVSAIVLLSVLLYQIMVYYNCKTEKINPKSIKYMLGTG